MRAAKKKYAYSFRAKIQKLPQTFCFVETSAAVSRAIVVRTAPVVGVIDSSDEFKATLMPRKNGRHILFLRAEVRKQAKVGIGDSVSVSFSIDSKSRDVETPDEVADALREEGLLDAFHAIAPGMRRQLLRWYGQAVQDATREKRIARLIEYAHAAREKQADRGL